MEYSKEVNEYLNGVYEGRNSISDAIPDNMKTRAPSIKQITIPFNIQDVSDQRKAPYVISSEIIRKTHVRII